MKAVMTRAWKIAKEAAVKFGGKAIEYIGGALKMAWEEFKNNYSHAARFENATFEEYVKKNKEIIESIAAIKEEAKTFEQEAAEVFAELDPAKFMVIADANKILRKASTTPARQEAYLKAFKEFKRKINAAQTVKPVAPGITGPIYDNDEKPTYF